ncbi:contractile injection system protein, VgrG/Pvc8 family, partial [Azotobacter chroococcum]|nr:contractile injection system protein, VgrG/Pvc8 family [Azotobacter chroococcum]
MDRNVKVHSVLGEEVLLFRAMTGTEALSQLFQFEIELLAESHSLALKTLLGSSLTLEIATQDEGVRYLNGLVTRCEL